MSLPISIQVCIVTKYGLILMIGTVEGHTKNLLRLSAQIVSAHVSKSAVSPAALPGLIQGVYNALANVDQPAAVQPGQRKPAVPINRSVFPDHIVCLEDGAKLKMLTRYLKNRFDLTPEQYRERWGLPRNYPMTAPNDTERLSRQTKQSHLGRKLQPQPVTRASKRRSAAKV